MSEAGAPALLARLSVLAGDGPEAFAVEADLALDRGVLVLFGPSGAGKTLTLQALAGLLRPWRGNIVVQGDTMYDEARRIFVPPEKRRIGYVPQLHALFPFLDVAGNVAFGLPRKERRPDNPRVVALLEELGLAHLARANPASLSGGERQRVALGRALIVEPRLLLLDEPFASIDQEGRAALRAMLRHAIDRRSMPAVLVTHDPEEALSLGDWLVRFERGKTTVAGDPARLLGRGKPVRVEGEAAGEVEPLDEGRARLRLREAVVEGPAGLFEGVGPGPVVLEIDGER
ncbi:MAG: ATP-binding cassette domain-containing protein [Byssovorax sp.]